MHPSSRNRPRGLRIGVVLGDTLIAEQTLEAGTFSIGRKPSCSVPLPFPELPGRWELFTADGHGLRLHATPAMDVRLADDAAVQTREQLARGAAGPIDVAIPAGARGKITLGEIKIMFHELELAPRAPRPALPPELRETLAERIDRRVLGFAAASLALHVGVMTAARLNDPAVELSQAEQVMADYEAQTTIIDAADLPDLSSPSTTPAQAQTPAASKTPATTEPAATPTTRPSTDRSRPTRPGQPVDPSADAGRAADELFASDDGGLVPGDAARRRPGGDLAQQLSELGDRQARAELGNGSDRDLPTRDGPELGTSQGPDVPALPSETRPTGPAKRPEPEHARITLTPPKRPPGEPSLDGIIGKIKTTYMTGLVRCYKRAMVEAGPMSGKIVIAFEVSEKGGVSGPSATGVDPQLEACVEGLMAGWRFLPVVDEDGDATEVDVKVTLQLRPD